jgi:hypothetical protein
MSLATQTLPSIEEAKELMTMAQIYPRRRARVPGLTRGSMNQTLAALVKCEQFTR